MTVLVAIGILYRAYPHMFFIPRWIVEEEYNYIAVYDLVRTGTSKTVGFYPMLEQYVIYFIYLLTHIDPIFLSQYANPVFGALATIPIYFILRKYYTQKISILGVAIFIFSETALYRSAYFGTTEPLGFLLATTALLFYQRNKYIPTVILLALGFYTHLLPTMFILIVIGMDIFFKANKKIRIFLIGVGFVVLLFLYSPYNPHQRIISSIDPVKLLSHFNIGNIFIYTFNELFLGLNIFAGFVLLCSIAVLWVLKNKDWNRLMNIYLFVATGLFIFSWLVYIPDLFAPPRLTFYFLIPTIFYAIKVISLFKGKEILIAALICLVSISASYSGLERMLYISDAVSLEEFEFLDEISKMVEISSVREWWTDYSLRVSLTSYYNAVPTTALNTAKVSELSQKYSNPNATATTKTITNTTVVVVNPITNITTTEVVTKITKTNEFKYVLISPRMENSGYFLLYSNSRTEQIHIPVVDIWANNPDWELIHEKYGIKLYRWIETIE